MHRSWIRLNARMVIVVQSFTIILLVMSFMANDSLYGQSLDGLRKPKHGNVFVVAHRGAHDGIPENTLAAYQRAIDLGCDFVEIDVRTTKDKRLVSVHDATVDKYTVDGTKGPVAAMTLDELKALDIGSRVDAKWNDERIPTVEEILDLCNGRIGIYLDIKAATLEDIHRLVADRHMEPDTLWYFGGSRVPELRKLSDRCWPMPDPGPEIFLKPLLVAHKPPIVASTWRFFSESYSKACHEANAIVIVDEGGRDSWDQMVAWGADGIQTDAPADLIEWLDSKR